MARNQFESSLKRFGLVHLNKDSLASINGDAYKEYIKAMYLPKGYKLTVDFGVYVVKQPSLFFVAPNQFLKVEQSGNETGYFIFYNRDFYCIQIHDHEVACDGLLFNNVQNMPMVAIPKEEEEYFKSLFHHIEEEFRLSESSQEEMIRTYLKQLLIRATRQWKKQHLEKATPADNSGLDFFRKFTILVDAHYRQKHTVADYADVLAMAPKTVTHKLRRLNLPQPNEIIKNRIMLEAKRLLVHTSLTAKEIAHTLGYDDPAYFSRQFQVKTGETPSGFRSKFAEVGKI